MDGLQLWNGADAVGRAVGLLLLAMSVCTWVLIGWKLFVLRRARRDLTRAVPAFWAAPDWGTAEAQVRALDREQLLLPLLEAARAPLPVDSLATRLTPEARIGRPLRDALQAVIARLRWGHVLLASIGATSPFVGLLGTVWGIYQALLGLSTGGSLSIERIAGPVGESLVMTAAGLVVAIPAVLAYNAFNQRVAACESELEGFAQDLIDLPR